MDGRGGAGKTTLTSMLVSASPGAQVLHIDDVDWNEPLYQWDHLLVTALGELHRAGSLDFTPPAWHRHGREGSIVVPAGAPFVIVEGTGAGMRAVVDLIDVHIWVQTDDGVAEERGIGRDTALGVNGDAEETIHFWHWWMAGERSFFAADRPWERAHLIVSGEPPRRRRARLGGGPASLTATLRRPALRHSRSSGSPIPGGQRATA